MVNNILYLVISFLVWLENRADTIARWANDAALDLQNRLIIREYDGHMTHCHYPYTCDEAELAAEGEIVELDEDQARLFEEGG